MDRWAAEVGDASWKYDDIVKYYQKAMNFEPPTPGARFANATPAYNPDLIATGGPLAVTYANYAFSWSTWVAVAMEGIGIPNTDSFINGALNGSAYNQNTINHTTGERASADRAYLRPYLHRPNLFVFDNSLAQKVVFDGVKATGVKITSGNQTKTLTARREVIISGGVFQSPQLLMVSGVGPASLLVQHNIDVVADRPGVGQNLDDQWAVGIGYRVNIETASTLALPAIADNNVQLFRQNQTGPLASPGGEYAGYEKIPEELRSNFSDSTKKGEFLHDPFFVCPENPPQRIFNRPWNADLAKQPLLNCLTTGLRWNISLSLPSLATTKRRRSPRMATTMLPFSARSCRRHRGAISRFRHR